MQTKPPDPHQQEWDRLWKIVNNPESVIDEKLHCLNALYDLAQCDLTRTVIKKQIQILCKTV